VTTRKNPEHRGRVIRASLKTAADPMQLWEAWADPARLAHWFPDRAEGRAVAGAVQTWFFDRFNYAMPYEVYSSVPGEHLVYTGQMPGRPRFYLEIDITREAGTTVLTLTNSGFLDKEGWDDEYEGIASGWQMALAMLKQYVEHYFGRPRVQFFAMRPAQYEFADLLPHYREANLLAEWLTSSGAIGNTGDRYALVLQDDGPASGEVLAVTGWEVQLSWTEIAGIVALKGFAMGPGRRAICIHGSSWSLTAERAAYLEKAFSAALDRLAHVLAPTATAPR
jgi:uncharacterized protein YndB with AHSA1/START domain